MTINEIFETIRDWAVSKFQPKGDYAVSSDIPTKVSELDNDEGYISSVPDNYVTDAELDTKGYLTEETDPTVPEWAKQPEKPIYTASEVGADVAGSAANALQSAEAYADSAISDHNASNIAHEDIRNLLNGKVDKENGKGLSSNNYTDEDKNKLDGISAGAEVNVQSDWNVTDADSDAYIKNKPNPASLPVSTAQQAAIDAAYQQATGYADQKIADLINGAPSTLDTLGEIAEAMQDNQDVVAALDQAIGTKANEADFNGHVSNNTIHTTASEKSAWNNKMEKTGDAKDATVTFISADDTNPTEWQDTSIMTSGSTLGYYMRKCSIFFKNVRYLWKLMGTTSLSGIGNGTVTGAISQLNTGLDWKLIGALYDSNTTMPLPTKLKEIQTVIGVGQYRMIFNMSDNALSAAVAGQSVVCSAKVFADGNGHEVSAIIKFNTYNAWVGLITLDESAILDFIVWFYYR